MADNLSERINSLSKEQRIEFFRMLEVVEEIGSNPRKNALHKLSMLERSQDVSNCEDVARALYEMCSDLSVRQCVLQQSSRITKIALEAYQSKSLSTAEYLSRLITDYHKGYSIATTLYAHMLRRGECSSPIEIDALIILNMLQEDVEKAKSCLGCVNMALTFAMNFGTEKDWHIASRIFDEYSSKGWLSEMPIFWDIKNINGKSTEAEDLLVQLFSLRANLLTADDATDVIAKIHKRLKKRIPDMPDWMGKCENDSAD